MKQKQAQKRIEKIEKIWNSKIGSHISEYYCITRKGIRQYLDAIRREFYLISNETQEPIEPSMGYAIWTELYRIVNDAHGENTGFGLIKDILPQGEFYVLDYIELNNGEVIEIWHKKTAKSYFDSWSGRKLHPFLFNPYF